MSFWIQGPLQFLHIFLAIFWFGSILYTDLILIPVVQGLSTEAQGAISGPIGQRTTRVIIPVSMAVVTLGLLRGVAAGVLGRLGSSYGITFVLSLILGAVLIVWGLRVIGPAAERLNAIAPGPELEAAIARIKTLALVELAMFTLALVFMILMRFGY